MLNEQSDEWCQGGEVEMAVMLKRWSWHATKIIIAMTISSTSLPFPLHRPGSMASITTTTVCYVAWRICFAHTTTAHSHLAQAAISPNSAWEVGSKVRVVGLVSASAAHHNEKIGFLSASKASKEDRVGVELDGKVFSIRKENPELLIDPQNNGNEVHDMSNMPPHPLILQSQFFPFPFLVFPFSLLKHDRLTPI